MKAHLDSRKGKGLRKEIILFNIKREEYIMWLIDSKNISISNFKIKTTDKQTIVIIGYDSLADFTYGKLKMYDDIFVYGKLRQNKIIANNIIKL